MSYPYEQTKRKIAENRFANGTRGKMPLINIGSLGIKLVNTKRKNPKIG